MPTKLRLEIPVAEGVAVLLDADRSPGTGINVESRHVVHCKEYSIQVVFRPYCDGKE